MDVVDRHMERLRKRWSSSRQRQAMTSDADPFALSGLGRLVEQLEMRALFLPSDPDSDVVPFDKETDEWLGAERPLPFNPQANLSRFDGSRSTVDALLRYDRASRGDSWRRYLALHRHGGVEVASDRMSYQGSDLRIFYLRRVVGLWWLVASLQAEAIERWQLKGPFEATIGLRNTFRATVGGFAEGWAEPVPGLDSILCLDDHVLLRLEIEDFHNVEALALNVGDRIEQAFGTVLRRHVARRGPYEGKFDPRSIAF